MGFRSRVWNMTPALHTVHVSVQTVSIEGLSPTRDVLLCSPPESQLCVAGRQMLTVWQVGGNKEQNNRKVHWETVKQTLKIKNIADSTDSSLFVVFNTRFHFALCELHSDWPTIAQAKVGHSGLPSLNNKFPFRPVLFLLASRKHVLHSGYKEKYTKKTVS